MAADADARQSLSQAIELHRAGKLALAEVLYRNVLRSQPRNAQALGMLGLIEAGRRNFDAASKLLRQSLEVHPDSAPMQFNLGLVCQELRQSDEALACFDRALALTPDAAQVKNARGVALKNLGRHEEALASYEEALALVPAFFDAMANRGIVLRYLGRHQESAAAFQQALNLRPDSTELQVNLGYALHQLGRYEDALAAYARALQLQPASHDAWNSRGMTLHALDRFEEAIESYRRALEIDPASAEATMNLGVSLYELRRFDEALARFEQALQLQPQSLDARVNLGNALMELDRPEEALACYREVANLRPGDQDVLMNMANVLRDMHRYPEAIALYEQALTLDESCADVHWNMALALLVMGEYERGWREYEWRKKIPSLHDAARRLATPAWDGTQPLQGNTIFVYAEQGLGDTLHICRYVNELASRGARVVLEAQRPLLALLASLEGVTQLIAPGEAVPPHDFHCALLSLPKAFGTRLVNVPARVPYLFTDPELVAQWRPVLERNAGLNIGLAWAGNAAYRNDHRRSIALEALMRALPGSVNYWSLQKEITPADEQWIAEHGRIGRFAQNDFVHTAAQITLLDAVVCVETSIAQLAIALGKPTFVLLAHTADWRWGWPGEDNPWYPTATLFRQRSRGDWSAPLNAVAARLNELAVARGSR